MLLGGLWHGASWTFVVWGALHGVGLIVCRVWQHLGPAKSPRSAMSYAIWANVLTFLFVTFAWIFFRSPDFATAALVLQRFGALTPATLVPLPGAALVLGLLLAAHVAFYTTDLTERLSEIRPVGFAFAYGAAIALILPFVNVNVQPFIYFQF